MKKEVITVVIYKSGRTYTIHDTHNIDMFFDKNGNLVCSIKHEWSCDDLVTYDAFMKDIQSIITYYEETNE